MAFDSTNYQKFLQNIFIKPRSSSDIKDVYFKDVGKLYQLSYLDAPLFVKNIEISGSNQAAASPQMVGNIGATITTYGSGSSPRIGNEVATVKFPTRTITLSGIAAISDSGGTNNWAWIYLMRDSLDYAFQKFYDPEFDKSRGPNLHNMSLDLTPEGLNWSISWEADGDSYLNFFKDRTSDSYPLTGEWKGAVTSEYNRYRIIKWYDMLICANDELFNFPGSTEFYTTKINLKWQITSKRFFNFGSTTIDSNYNKLAPIYAPVKLTQDFVLEGISPVSIASNSFSDVTKTGTSLFMTSKSLVDNPFYLRFGNNSDINSGNIWIPYPVSKSAQTMLREVKYSQSPDGPTQLSLSGLMVYS